MRIFTASATCEIPSIVASLCGGNPLEKRIVFCEDKFTLALELAIAKAHGGTFGTHVFSFNRYMHKRLPNDKQLLSTEACSLVVKGLLLQYKPQLSCFKKVSDPTLASTVYELIAQLKSARVTPSDIERAIEQTSGNLKRKLKDIYLLFSGYEKYLEERRLTDGNNRLYRLPSHFKSDNELKDTHVIIAGFPSLNRTLCDIFKAICSRAKQVDFVVVAGKNKGVYTNEIYNFITFEYPQIDYCSADGPSYRKTLLEGLFNPSYLAEKLSFEKPVEIYQASDANDEIVKVARAIKEGVIAGANYKDFSICAEDISAYELTIRRVFEDYDIPFFFDTTKNLGKHPITRFVCAYLDLARRNFDLSDLFTFVKNPLFCANKKIADGFENYCISHSINRKTVKKTFEFPTEIDQNYLLISQYENLRQTAVEVVSYLDEAKTFSDVCQAINKTIERVCAFENLTLLSSELEKLNREDTKAYNDQAQEKFEGVMADALALLGDLEFSLVEVKNVLLSGMTACQISIIPKYFDCVFVGDFRSVRYNEVKYLFALGLTDAVPVSKIDTALLCDRDIAKMEKAQVLVEPKIKEVNRRAREIACMAVASFSEKLYLSFPSAVVGGGEGKPSEIIRYVSKIFGIKVQKHNEKSNVGAEFGASAYLTRKSAIKYFAKEVSDYKDNKLSDFSNASAYYKAVSESEDGKIAGNILTSSNAEVGYVTEGVDYAHGKLSATAIEGHFRCPYANFLQRGVKLLDREEIDIRANDLGTMVHSVGEEFVDKVDWEKSEEEARKLAEEIFDKVVAGDDYKRYQQSESGKRSFEFIKKESVRFCMNLFETGLHSSLKPKHVEVYFGGSRYPAIKVSTQKGEMKITGKVDRIDSDGKNMAVIDYKTGKVDKNNTEQNLYSGQKLQLFLYANAFSDKYTPIGAYYMPVSNEFVEREEEIEKGYVGKTIANEELASIVDNTLQDGSVKGRYVNANFTRKKDGEFRWPQGLLSEREFKAYMTYAKSVAGKGLLEITDGVIVPSPYEGACDYCKYLGICGYSEESDLRTREVSEIKKVDILRAVNMAEADENNDKGDE